MAIDLSDWKKTSQLKSYYHKIEVIFSAFWNSFSYYWKEIVKKIYDVQLIKTSTYELNVNYELL